MWARFAWYGTEGGIYSPTRPRPGLMAVVGAPSCCAVNMATGKQPRPKDCLSLRTAPFTDGGATGVLLAVLRKKGRGGVVGLVRRARVETALGAPCSME